MSPPDMQKTIKKKASESAAYSPIDGRTLPSFAAPSLQEIMDGLHSMQTPQPANLKTNVVSSVSTSLNERFMDLENNLDQLKTTTDTQQQATEAELSQVLQRRETVKQENATLRGASSSSTNQKMSKQPYLALQHPNMPLLLLKSPHLPIPLSAPSNQQLLATLTMGACAPPELIFLPYRSKTKVVKDFQFFKDITFCDISANTDPISTKQRPFDRSILAPT